MSYRAATHLPYAALFRSVWRRFGRGSVIRCASAPSSVSSSRPSLSWSSRPAGYTPAGNPNSASVRRGGTLRSVNWHSTWKGLLRARRSEERRVGKECSVRVDLGGRRILKKKNLQQAQREKKH